MKAISYWNEGNILSIKVTILIAGRVIKEQKYAKTSERSGKIPENLEKSRTVWINQEHLKTIHNNSKYP